MLGRAEPTGRLAQLRRFVSSVKLRRHAAAVDAFLLKIVIEERLGYPVQLVSDGLIPGLQSALNLSGVASVYAALSSGEVHIYPEAR